MGQDLFFNADSDSANMTYCKSYTRKNLILVAIKLPLTSPLPIHLEVLT